MNWINFDGHLIKTDKIVAITPYENAMIIDVACVHFSFNKQYETYDEYKHELDRLFSILGMHL